jgi:DNA-nicking Smr family endonuclease
MQSVTKEAEAALPDPRNSGSPPVNMGLQSVPPVRSSVARFDPGIEQRILKGQARIQARLDLHGMTEAAAYAALTQFILRSTVARYRLLLVVTGKGSMGTGILKRNLPRWLDSSPLASSVLSVRPAYDRHGGEGAFYVLLRKQRGD